MADNAHPERQIITVTLNPTIDRVVEVSGFRVGEHLKGILRHRQPSGKAFNVSRALAALGRSSTASGFVGEDAAVQFELAARALGIAPCFVPLAGRTRENTTIIDPINHTETHIREEGPPVTSADVHRLLQTLLRLVMPDAVVVLTGSLAPGISIEDFGRILDDCLARGARLVVDTSGAALGVAAKRSVWLLKPNREELAELVGHPARSESDLLADGKRVLANSSNVLLSAGEDGAYLFTGQGVWHGSLGLPVGEVRSTVGCGDALLAGYLATVIQSGNADEGALRHAVAVAAASALNELPASFSTDDVNRLSPQVQLRRLGT